MQKMENKANSFAGNKKIAYALVLVSVAMIFLTIASVPLYNLFCKVTGYGGTVKINPLNRNHKIGTKIITVRFDANVDKNLPWKFKSEQEEVTIKIGENNLVFFSAENLSDHDIIGTAVYNVTPFKAGQYFNKIQCFCFEQQLLKAKQKILMPVSFFIDQEFENNHHLDDVDTITLSYTFYPAEQL